MRTPILAFVLALMLVGCGARPQSERSGAHGPDLAQGDVAKVGSQFISTAQVDALLRETAVSFRALDRPFPKVGTPYYLDLRDQAVGYLVRRSVRAQAADRLGAGVDAAELRRELERIDQSAFREQARRSALTMERVSTDLHDQLLEIALFRAVVSQKRSDETNVEAMKHWEKRFDEQVAATVYAPGWKPAQHLRSPIPPELRELPKATGPCDLKNGTFTIREVAAHGCAEDFGLIVPGRDGTPCPEIPIDDFAVAGLPEDPAYGAYEEALMDSAPSCAPYPSTTYTVETGKGPCFPYGPDDPCAYRGPVPQTVVTAN